MEREPRPHRHSGHPLWLGTVALVVCIGSYGCSNDECYDNKNTLPQTGFYAEVEGKTEQVSLSGVEIYGIGAPGDSILSTGSSSVSSLYMPLRTDTGFTEYVLHYLSSDPDAVDVRDTISFRYTTEPRFVSAACGVSYLFEMEEIGYTTNMIDSVVCMTPQVTNAPLENFRIYFHLPEDEPENPDDPDNPENPEDPVENIFKIIRQWQNAH